MITNSSSLKWLSIVGIGEDGLAGVTPIGRSLIAQAEVLIGGDRHLKMLPAGDSREQLLWSSPIEESINTIINRRGERVCVLASGDPMCYGIGVTLTRRIPIAEITIIPSPSTFSLVCARLGWCLTEVETVSLCGRNPALLKGFLYPNARVLVLSADKETPAVVAQILIQQGFGSSKMWVLEYIGGSREGIVEAVAATWDNREVGDLNSIAITCIPDIATMPYLPPRMVGLPDSAYHHDGQLTKREIRAVTLSALAPLPGQLLWDVGAGCGSIGIEWMRSDARCRAIAIERDPSRVQYIANNAAALGTPHLNIIVGEAPVILQDLPTPDAIFIGGGVTGEKLLETCWNALSVGGRLVANAVTIEGEQKLFQWQQKLGGELSRIAIQRAEPIGKFLGWKAMSPVTQWTARKP